MILVGVGVVGGGAAGGAGGGLHNTHGELLKAKRRMRSILQNVI